MKLASIIKEEDYTGYMSSHEQQARIDKMWVNDDGLMLVYMWVKQGHISLKEFKELVETYTKE